MNPEPWLLDNPRIAYNAGLVRSMIDSAAYDAVCELRGIPSADEDDDAREAYENSDEGLQLACELNAAVHAALAAFAEDELVRTGDLTLGEYLQYLNRADSPSGNQS